MLVSTRIKHKLKPIFRFNNDGEYILKDTNIRLQRILHRFEYENIPEIQAKAVLDAPKLVLNASKAEIEEVKKTAKSRKEKK